MSKILRDGVAGANPPIPRINIALTAKIATSGLAAVMSEDDIYGMAVRVYKLEGGDDFTISEGAATSTIPMADGEYVDLWVTNQQVLAGNIRILAVTT